MQGNHTDPVFKTFGMPIHKDIRIVNNIPLPVFPFWNN